MEKPSFNITNLEFYGSEKAAIVLEIGHAYTKCGFAGEVSPRHIIPTKFVLVNGEKVCYTRERV
jgi:hypothetical protein